MEATGAARAVIEAAVSLLPVDVYYRVCSKTGEKQPIPLKTITDFIRRRVNSLARDAGNGSGKAVPHGSKRPGEPIALCGGRVKAALLTPHTAISLDSAGEEQELAMEEEPAEEEAEAAERGASICRSLTSQLLTCTHR
jgi:hypothetical protein